jgi:signal transduction histidine kinase
MNIQNAVRQELHKIHRSRSRIAYLPNLISLSISLYFQRENLPLDDRWFIVIILMSLGTFLKVLINEIFFEEWSSGVRWAKGGSYLGTFLLASAWGLHFTDVHNHFGAEAQNVSYTLLIIVAFLTASSTTLLADQISYYLYMGTLSLFVASTYLLDPKLINSYIILNIILYDIVSIGQFRISYKQLCDLIQAQLTTTQEKERLLNFINTVPGFVGLVGPDFICYMANQNTLRVFPGIIGKKLGDIDPNSEWENSIIAFLQSDKQSGISEQQAIHRAETHYSVLSFQRMTDGGVIVVSLVTTELVLAQKTIREQEAKAQYSANLASLGAMAAGIAHEVNNPLAIIQGAANVVRRLVDESPMDISTIKILTTKMIETSDRISKTVRSLKALSRNGENDPKGEVIVDKVILDSMDISSQQCRDHGITLEVHTDQKNIKVYGREVQLIQVLVNLIANAIDAVGNLPEKWIKIQVRVNGDFIEVLVIDSGNGIPEDIRAKIMEPFFTTKDVNQGTGLGLSISKNIVKDHGGELSILPMHPHTTFQIKLPLHS